ncbi:uncharacterized protein JN550_001522 [Neoarthrinium moseri]|uniref:uncharacterized protein n=1 Tax=Neoarthrinium moseri TaxID=1658444 RepID=UPI001FDCEEA8|nr:uncharacterized protein JN550_001522 [Neoarthrinium moseri]KAI1876026.1 hypothetical protein JN550_001522 [Neoarthrinium moseri]
MATPQTSQHFRLTQCQNCLCVCPDVEGRRPLCSDCADEFRRRKERVVDRVRGTSMDAQRPSNSRTLSYESGV